jgi:hypothetical protein
VKQLLKAPAVLLLVLAVVIGLAGVGWVVFDQFLNHPHWTITEELHDELGRDVSAAPWFVKTFLPFLTDSVSSPPEYDVTRTVMAPFAPGKYWLGWAWSFADWGGLILVFMIAYGMGAAGLFLWGTSSYKVNAIKETSANEASG